MHDLPTYYLLPLIGINFKDFGFHNNKSNLISTKINIETLRLICEVKTIKKVPETAFKLKRYEGTFNNLIYYEFPSSLPETLKAFKHGKYSEIPTSIKRYIKANCGLPASHDVLLALKKDVKLKLKLEKNLEVKIDENAELLSIPEKEWFVV